MSPFLILGSTEVILVVGAIALLFGASRIPTLMRNLGSGVKSFKEGMRDGALSDDNKAEEKKEETKKD